MSVDETRSGCQPCPSQPSAQSLRQGFIILGSRTPQSIPPFQLPSPATLSEGKKLNRFHLPDRIEGARKRKAFEKETKAAFGFASVGRSRRPVPSKHPLPKETEGFPWGIRSGTLVSADLALRTRFRSPRALCRRRTVGIGFDRPEPSSTSDFRFTPIETLLYLRLHSCSLSSPFARKRREEKADRSINSRI